MRMSSLKTVGVQAGLPAAILFGADLGTVWPSLAILGACLRWSIDNNPTRKIALTDASWLAAVKGGVAGPVNLAIAFVLGAALPPVISIAASMVVRFFAYRVSVVLFIIAMRHVGTARAGAYFSIAPFFGALLAVILGAPITLILVIAALLMALVVWLHLTERHEHEHVHEAITHDHWHVHDEHHRHEHPEMVAPDFRHRHVPTHDAITHSHEHYSAAHHRHSR